MVAGHKKFAEQDRATQECDLSGSAIQRQSRGLGTLAPCFPFFSRTSLDESHRETGTTSAPIPAACCSICLWEKAINSGALAPYCTESQNRQLGVKENDSLQGRKNGKPG